jgi:formamidopyrimidine-DNA glycosylase
VINNHLFVLLDEILYHSRVHPERRCNALTDDELTLLHHHTRQVCDIAVAANADDTKFPEDWLFKHRWVCPLFTKRSNIRT